MKSFSCPIMTEQSSENFFSLARSGPELESSAALQVPLQQQPQPLQSLQRILSRRDGKGSHLRRPNRKFPKSRKQEEVDMKPNVVVDEMFPEGAGPYMDIDEAGGSSGLLMDLAANEKSVHTDFFNQFDDLYDDEDLS